MKRLLILCAFALATNALSAQINRMDVEFRGDWQHESIESESLAAQSGFEGKYFNFRMDGNLAANLSYSIRYRINKVQRDPFAATDWATLTYATDSWDFSAGKQVVAIGGYEYDRAPIDIYFASEYWHQIACYQFGASATYKFNDKVGSKLLGQVCQSPYDFANENLYAYNLMYINKFCLSSVNMLEYAPGKYIGYLALGARETYGDVTVELDWMGRRDFENGANSYSTMLDVQWSVNEKLNLFTHASMDFNQSKVMFDPTVLPGTEIYRLGGGAEYFPTGKRNVRIHAATSYTFGNQGNPAGGLQDNHLMFQLGLTWRINII